MTITHDDLLKKWFGMKDEEIFYMTEEEKLKLLRIYEPSGGERVKNSKKYVMTEEEDRDAEEFLLIKIEEHEKRTEELERQGMDLRPLFEKMMDEIKKRAKSN